MRDTSECGTDCITVLSLSGAVSGVGDIGRRTSTASVTCSLFVPGLAPRTDAIFVASDKLRGKPLPQKSAIDGGQRIPCSEGNLVNAVHPAISVQRPPMAHRDRPPRPSAAVFKSGGLRCNQRRPDREIHVNMTDNMPPLLFDVHNKHEMTKTDLRQVVAIAVISRLQEWCIQLLRITILCVIGFCDDEESPKPKASTSQKKTNLAELEMKVLRHLTSPQLASRSSKSGSRRPKRRPASRPPSPQLFDIAEEE